MKKIGLCLLIALMFSGLTFVSAQGGQETEGPGVSRRASPRQLSEDAALYPGENREWLPAAGFGFYGLPELKQPAGTNASYDNIALPLISNRMNDITSHTNRINTTGHEYANTTIYLTGGSNQVTAQNLKQQIEAATRKTMTNNRTNSFVVEMPHPDNTYEYYTIQLEWNNDVVSMKFNSTVSMPR